MDKAKISLDWECWPSKPSTTLQYNDAVDKYGNPRTQTRVIGARLGSVIQEVSPKDLARYIAMGRTWSPFTFKECPHWGRPRRLEGLFDQCQILGVDFDDGRSVDDIVNAARGFGITYTLIHHSFSSTPAHPKLRGVIFMDQPLDDFDRTRTLSTGLAYLLDGDKSCVDVARMFYGSTSESVISLQPGHCTPVSLLESLTKGVDIPRIRTTTLNKPKEDGEGWGSMGEQKKSWAMLSKSQKAFILAKLNGVRKELNEFKGQGGRSRYDCVWRNASRLARMPELMGSTVYDMVYDCVTHNKYFDDWDKDPEAVIKSAIEWSFNHADERVGIEGQPSD